MFRRKDQPRLRDVLKEMTYDAPALRDPEEIDREIAAEAAEAEDENRVVDPIPEGSERALNEMIEAEEVHRDLICGVIALSMLMFIGLIWARPMLRYALGVVIGAGVAVYLLIHMYRSISWELTMEPKQAETYAKRRTAIRYAVVLLAMIAVMSGLGRAAGIGCILSIVTVKPAAYLQPLTSKIRRRLGRRR